jgi:hypothetical protein
MKLYSITQSFNINDLPNEDGKYPHTIIKIDNKDIEPFIVWADNVKEAIELAMLNLKTK